MIYLFFIFIVKYRILEVYVECVYFMNLVDEFVLWVVLEIGKWFDFYKFLG